MGTQGPGSRSAAWLVALKDSPFAELEEAVLEELVRSAISVHYEAGDLLFQEGGFAAGLHLIREGLILYGKYAGDRRHKRVLKILKPGELVGVETLFKRFPCEYPGYAQALRDSEVLFIRQEVFFNLGREHPELLRALAERLARELVIMECKLVESSYESLERNLVRLLVVLGQRYGAPAAGAGAGAGGLMIDLDLSREELAQMLGVHTDTLIKVLAKLKARGWVGQEGRRLILLDLAALERQARPETTCLCESLF